MDGRIGEILVSIATKSSLCRTVADVDDRPGDPLDKVSRHSLTAFPYSEQQGHLCTKWPGETSMNDNSFPMVSSYFG